MDRCWLLTSTTYGAWLPGDSRGFVSNVADETGRGVRHNERGAAYDADLPALQAYMQQQLKGTPILLNEEQAQVILRQFQETARYRGWLLLAVGVMANHFHLLVGVEGDPSPDKLLGDFKSYASRALNRLYDKPASGTWWTESGSKRKKTGPAILDAVDYIRRQYRPLVIWVNEEAVRLLASGGRQPPVAGRKTQQGADAPRSPEADEP